MGCGAMVFCPRIAIAAGDGPSVFGIPVDFVLFALTLLGVALFHHYTLRVALIGLATITIYKLAFTGFKSGTNAVGGIGDLEGLVAYFKTHPGLTAPPSRIAGL